jgi:hypothetical protein
MGSSQPIELRSGLFDVSELAKAERRLTAKLNAFLKSATKGPSN